MSRSEPRRPTITQRPRPNRRPTLEESAEVDELVRKAAVATFLDHGFAGATIDAVARAAGVTRATVYARYPDKDTLFRTVIPWALKEQSVPAVVIDPTADLRTALLTIATAAYERATDPESARLGVLLMNEVPRFPKLVPRAQQFDRYPFAQSVIDLLRQHQEAGDIDVDDLDLAAEQFLALVASHPAHLSSFGMRRDADSARRYLEQAVDLFVAGTRSR